MSQTCSIESCKRSSCALCLCCQQKICLPHLKEHQDLLVSELNPLVDQINAIGDRLKALNLEKKMKGARQKLEEWRVECHQKIDYFFKQKYRELDRQVAKTIEKQRQEINQIQLKVAELTREEHATRAELDLLTSRIRDLEREMKKIERTSFNIRCQSLEIDDNWITIEESRQHRFDFSSLPPIYKTIKSSDGSSVAMATNERFLLMHQKPNLCLVDGTLTIVKQGLWNNGRINDMCWSSVLDRFIVMNDDNVFLVDQSTLSVESISAIREHKWCSCTCSDVSLYLSTFTRRSSIIEYSLSPSIIRIKHWKSPDSCQNDEVINNVKYNSETLALLITNFNDKTVRIELRASKTLQRLWSLRLDIENVQNEAFCFCSINEDEWLVADYQNSRLIHVTGDGKVKVMCTYSSIPECLCTFGSDILAVVSNIGINFHKL